MVAGMKNGEMRPGSFFEQILVLALESPRIRRCRCRYRRRSARLLLGPTFSRASAVANSAAAMANWMNRPSSDIFFFYVGGGFEIFGLSPAMRQLNSRSRRKRQWGQFRWSRS